MNLVKLILIIVVVSGVVYLIHDYQQQGAPNLYPTPTSDQLPEHAALIERIGPMLVLHNGRVVQTEQLAKTKYVMLYFSAGWCGPCKRFTPELIRYYEQHKEKGEFEILLVSGDHSAKDMMQYMERSKIPFPAIPFNRVIQSGLANQYGGRGIPNLVLIDQYGNIVSNSYVRGEYVGPRSVLQDMNTLIENRS